MTAHPTAARKIAFSAALAAVLWTAGRASEEVGTAGRGADSNVLANGGFEDGFDGWSPAPGHEIVRDRGVARSGRACLSGEVTRPQQALILRRRVPVEAGNRYEFEVWARATNRTKLVLWVLLPGGKQRRMAASWSKVPPRWTRYRTPLAVTRDGTLELQIVAPSSHGEPPGRIWLDDAALHATPLPALTPVSAGAGFNDEPAMARAADGSLYIAWNSFRDGADSVRLARYTAGGEKLERRGAWQLAGGAGTSVLGVTAVPAGDGAAVLYASEVEGEWDIHAVLCDPKGPGRRVRVTARRGVDIKPAAAWHAGVLHVVWESNRDGSRRIYASAVRDGKADDAAAVSPAGLSSYDPAIAVLSGGTVAVAWHSFRENNYDIYLARRTADGPWSEPRRLTRAPTIDRHPLLRARGGELWLVYENASTNTYHVGATNRRHLVVARVTPAGLEAPSHAGGVSPITGRCEAADLRFDAAGRPWLAFLRPHLPRAGWDVFLACHAGGRWRRPAAVSPGKGMDRRPALALFDGRAVVAFQSDNLPNSWSDVDKTASATSDIFLATVAARDVPAAALRLAPLVESDAPFEAGELRVARGEDLPAPSITYQGRTLKLFFGDLHEHTDISICNRVGDQSVDESYQHMRDLARHDFACVTDHGYNINAYLWAYTAKMARANEDPGRFLTFLAEEWTSSFEKYDEKHPYGYYGHRNLILADPYFPRWWNSRNGQTPAQVWEELRAAQANFVHIPHQLADTGNVPTDWDFTDEKAQPVAEIFQTRGSYEYQGAPRQAKRATPKPGYFLQDAWARGIVIGVIASPDHGGGYGKACVYAPELTRTAILDAIRMRHCYGTTAAKIVLDVRVNGHLMGEKIAAPAAPPVAVRVAVRCPAPLDRVEVCRNNRFIYTLRPEGRNVEFTYTDRAPLEGRSYYYVRVIQADGEIAWSSPVWFGAE